jgi:hypothetical protein
MRYGMWIWNLARCEGGDAARIAARARTVGLDHVVLKIADGTALYNGTLLRPVIETLRASDITVSVWTYTYGRQPEREAEVFGERATRLGVQSLVVDLEGDRYAERDGHERVQRFFSALRATAPTAVIVLSSHRFPSLHPAVPIADAIAWCDAGDPQCYYLHPNVVKQTERALREWSAFRKPLAATGAAYPEGLRAVGDMSLFVGACRRASVDTVRWWSWEHATAEMWQTIAQITREEPV